LEIISFKLAAAEAERYNRHILIMANSTECPKCKKEFIIKSNLKYRLRASLFSIKFVTNNMLLPWKSDLEEIYRAHLVVCPNCRNEFSTPEYKYFGVLNVKQFQFGLIIFLLCFIFAPLVILFWGFW